MAKETTIVRHFAPAVAVSAACLLASAGLAHGQAAVFNATGQIQQYVVPQSATSVTIRAIGAHGGLGSPWPGGNFAGAPGRGALIQGDFPVMAGQVLWVMVGMAGHDGRKRDQGYGGWVATGGGGSNARDTMYGGSGGGSSNRSTNQVNQAGGGTGNGQVTITAHR